MALNIPLPAPDTRLFDELANAYIQRKKFEQEKGMAEQQFGQELTQRQAEQEALQKYRQQQIEQAATELELKKAASQRTGELQPQKMKLLEEKIRSEQAKQKAALFPKAMDPLTTANITKNQSMIQAVDTVIPLLKKIDPAKSPGTIMSYFKRDLAAAYHGKTSEALETLMSAMNLPKTDASLKKVESMIERRTGESDKGYQNRLNDLIKNLQTRKNESLEALRKGIVGEPGMPSETRTLNGVTYTQMNGKWYKGSV